MKHGASSSKGLAKRQRHPKTSTGTPDSSRAHWPVTCCSTEVSHIDRATLRPHPHSPNVSQEKKQPGLSQDRWEASTSGHLKREAAGREPGCPSVLSGLLRGCSCGLPRGACVRRAPFPTRCQGGAGASADGLEGRGGRRAHHGNESSSKFRFRTKSPRENSR